MRRAKISGLPKAVREWLDAALAKNFGDYKALEEELAKRGFSISKSSIHRYGSNLERRLSAIKASTEAAALIAKTAPDDADQRSAAVMSIVQSDVFNTVVALQEAGETDDPEKRLRLLSSAAKNIAMLSRASIHQKKHELEIRAKVAVAQKNITAAAKKAGASPDLIKVVEEQFLGISR